MVLTIVSHSYMQNMFKNDRPTFKFRKSKEWRAPGEGICFRGANFNLTRESTMQKLNKCGESSSSAAIPEQDFRYRVEWHNSVMRITRAPLSMRRVITYSARTEAAAARRHPESASERTNDANYYSCVHVLHATIYSRSGEEYNKQTISVEYKERATLDKQRQDRYP